jgi:large subunit ribosomal protein L30
MPKAIKVTLVKSVIAGVPKNRKTVAALGLGDRIGRSAIHDDTPAIRGMIHQVKHLVTVVDATEEEAAKAAYVREKRRSMNRPQEQS